MTTSAPSELKQNLVAAHLTLPFREHNHIGRIMSRAYTCSVATLLFDYSVSYQDLAISIPIFSLVEGGNTYASVIVLSYQWTQ